MTSSTHVPDPLLLKLPTVADAEAANDLLRRLSSTVGTPLHLKRQSVMSWWVVDNAGSPLETAELDALAVRLAAEPEVEVEVAELNRILTPRYIPSDPDWDNQWWATLVDLPTAWDAETGSASAVVAIVDTGSISNHEDLLDGILGGSQRAAAGGVWRGSTEVSAQDVAVEEEPSGERLETRVGVDRRRDHFRGPGELHEVEQVVQRLPKKR